MQRLVFLLILVALIVGAGLLMTRPKGSHPLAGTEKFDLCAIMQQAVAHTGNPSLSGLEFEQKLMPETAGACELINKSRNMVLAGSIATNRSFSLSTQSAAQTSQRMMLWDQELRIRPGTARLEGPWKTGLRVTPPRDPIKQVVFEDDGIMLELMSEHLPTEQMVELGKNLAKMLREQANSEPMASPDDQSTLKAPIASSTSSALRLCNTDAWLRYEAVSKQHNEKAFNKTLTNISQNSVRATQRKLIEADLKNIGFYTITFFDANENYHSCRLEFQSDRPSHEVIITSDGRMYYTRDGQLLRMNPFNPFKLVAHCAKIISDCADKVAYNFDQCANKARACPAADPIMNGYDCCLDRCISRYNDLRKKDVAPKEAFFITFPPGYTDTSCLGSLISNPY